MVTNVSLFLTLGNDAASVLMIYPDFCGSEFSITLLLLLPAVCQTAVRQVYELNPFLSFCLMVFRSFRLSLSVLRFSHLRVSYCAASSLSHRGFRVIIIRMLAFNACIVYLSMCREGQK